DYEVDVCHGSLLTNPMNPGLRLIVVRQAEISGVEDRRIGSRESDSEAARCDLSDEDLSPSLLEVLNPSTAVLRGRLSCERERCEPERPGYLGDCLDFRTEPGEDYHLLASIFQVLQNRSERL